MQDYQSAAINNTEQGWTTRGYPEGRSGGTYQNHLRYRDYFADRRVTVALRLDPEAGELTLDDLAEVLQEPARPLFIGRKPCLPSAPLFAGFGDSETALAALRDWPLDARRAPESVRLLWPDGEDVDGIDANRRYMLTDQRNWVSGLHGGGRAGLRGGSGAGQIPRLGGTGEAGMTTTTTAATQAATPQMVRAEIDVREFQRWMGSKRLQDPDHAMHCLLKECFGELAPKPFRLIIPRGGSSGVFYGYGKAGAEELRESAAICADPLQCRVILAGQLDSKPMPTEWQAGKRLGFEARIRPVARRSRNADDRPTRECDVFLREALQHPEKGGMTRSREEVYADWLSGQIDRIGGAVVDIENTKLVSFQRTRAIRKLHGRHSEGPDAVMRGNLTITDSTAFAALLARGVGRHRAYGYGMLLLRPASA